MKKTVKIEGMHCGHCSARVIKAIEAMGAAVTVDLDAGIAVIEGDDIGDAVIKETIEDLGFDVVEIK